MPAALSTTSSGSSRSVHVSEGVTRVIVTVTLNAALDRSLTVPIFKLGHRHRASNTLALAGGKGINVARALKRPNVASSPALHGDTHLYAKSLITNPRR